MKTLMTAAAAVLATASVALAQSTPDLKGTWSGKWRTVILGSNPHHPPSGPADAPRVREITFTFEIEGQDGRLIWGKSWSSPERKEPFVASITGDGRTIIGADSDGSLTMRMGRPRPHGRLLRPPRHRPVAVDGCQLRRAAAFAVSAAGCGGQRVRDIEEVARRRRAGRCRCGEGKGEQPRLIGWSRHAILRAA